MRGVTYLAVQLKFKGLASVEGIRAGHAVP
jgi:hypothetical protein